MGITKASKNKLPGHDNFYAPPRGNDSAARAVRAALQAAQKGKTPGPKSPGKQVATFASSPKASTWKFKSLKSAQRKLLRRMQSTVSTEIPKEEAVSAETPTKKGWFRLSNSRSLRKDTTIFDGINTLTAPLAWFLPAEVRQSELENEVTIKGGEHKGYAKIIEKRLRTAGPEG